MRDKTLDISKGVLITLVVFGHFLDRFIGWTTGVTADILEFIYLIHMPAFIFLAGMFYKESTAVDRAKEYLSYFLLFNFGYVLLNFFLTGSIGFKLLNMPAWTMWFMFALPMFYLMTLIFTKLKHPILLSLIFSIYIGLVSTNNYVYSIGRILTFYPFFLLGFCYGKVLIEKMKESVKFYNLLSILILSSAAVVCVNFSIEKTWLFGVANVVDFQKNIGLSILVKTILSIASSALLLSFIHLCRYLPSFFEKLGKRSLSIYLLHALVITLLIEFIAFDVSEMNLILISLAMTLVTVLILKEDVFHKLVTKIPIILRIKK